MSSNKIRYSNPAGFQFNNSVEIDSNFKVVGSLQLNLGSENTGYYLTCDNQGNATWTPFGITGNFSEDIQDIVGQMFTGVDNSNISYSYNDSTGKIESSFKQLSIIDVHTDTNSVDINDFVTHFYTLGTEYQEADIIVLTNANGGTKLYIHNGSNTGTSSDFTIINSNLDYNFIRAAFSAISPLIYNSSTGQFSIQKSDSTHDGYLSSQDWNIFNNKSNLTQENVEDIVGNQFTSNTVSGIITVYDDNSGKINVTNTDKGSNQNIFKTISVTGQSSIVATNNTDTLNIIAGTNISINTNPSTNSLTINNVQNSFTVFAVSGQSNILADQNNDTLTLAVSSGIDITTDSNTDTITFTNSDKGSSQFIFKTFNFDTGSISASSNTSTITFVGNAYNSFVATSSSVTLNTQNFFNTNLSLISDRTHSLNNKTLTFTGDSNSRFHIVLNSYNALVLDNNLARISSNNSSIVLDTNITFTTNSIITGGNSKFSDVNILTSINTVTATNSNSNISLISDGSVVITNDNTNKSISLSVSPSVNTNLANSNLTQSNQNRTYTLADNRNLSLAFTTSGFGNMLVFDTTDSMEKVNILSDLYVGGNLTVGGGRVDIIGETVNIADNFILLNSNVTGTPSENAGIEINRGSSNNTGLRWNETTDTWEVTYDGTNYFKIWTSGNQGSGSGLDSDTLDSNDSSYYLNSSNQNSGTLPIGRLTGTYNIDISGNSSTSSKWLTARTITLSGDVSGSTSIDGSSNVIITTTIQPNSVALGTDTTGNFVSDLTSSSGIGLSGGGIEGAIINITNTDKGSSQSIFKTINVQNSTGNPITNSPILASSNTDQFSLKEGTNISFSVSSNTITINTIPQMVFNSVNVNGTNLIADSSNDTLTINQGNGISLTSDANTDTFTISLSSVTQTNTGSFVKVSIDGFGRVSGNTPVLTSDLTPLLDATYVNTNGDTMTGKLVHSANTAINASMNLPSSNLLLTIPNSGDVWNYNNDLKYYNGTVQKTFAFVEDLTNQSFNAMKDYCRVASTANIAGTYNPATHQLISTSLTPISIDGVTLLVGDRILLKNQNTASQNGIYTITQLGLAGILPYILTRATDFDSSAEIQPNVLIGISEGTINQDKFYYLTTNASITLDVTNLTFVDLLAVDTESIQDIVGSMLTGTQTGITVTYDDPNNNISFIVNSAPIWTTARTITLTGDVTGSTSIDGSSNVTINTTVQPNSVALGNDTTGNYVLDLTQGTGINLTGNGGSEGANITVALTNITQANTGSFVKVSIDGQGRITGNTNVVASDITSLIDAIYVNTSGDTMTGKLILPASSASTSSLNITNSAITNAAPTAGDIWNFNNDLKYYNGSQTKTIALVEDLTSSNNHAIKTNARVATTANLNGVYNPANKVFTSTSLLSISIDGVNLALNDRVLLKDQTTSSQNGIYFVSQLGLLNILPYTLTRATDFDSSAEIQPNVIIGVSEGTTNSDQFYYLSTDAPITLDTTGLTFINLAANTEIIQDIVGAMTGTQNGISVTYNDAAGTMNYDVNDFSITLTGNVTGSGTVTNLANVSIATTLNGSYPTGTGTDNRITRWDGTNNIQNSGVTIDDSNNMSGIVNLDMSGVQTRTGALYSSNVKKYSSVIQTTNATATEMFTDGTSTRISIPANTVSSFRINLTVVIPLTGASKIFRVSGGIKNILGTTSLVGTVDTVTVASDAGSAGTIAVTASDANDALILTATGAALTTIRWFAEVELVTVSTV